MTHRIASPLRLSAAAVLAAGALVANSAAADVTLVNKDGWTVFINGRVQAFLNYNNGNGRPANLEDANCTPTGPVDPVTMMPTNVCNDVQLRDGGLPFPGAALPEYPEGIDTGTSTDQGKVEELRIRTGFTGNVLGFGIKKQITPDTDVTGYTAVTVGIDSEARRKFNPVRPDWRESYFRVTAPWGSITAGRFLSLHSRGATEITYLYGYQYGLGFPGNVSNESQSTAGHVGFGVLGNGFGAGFAYATPSLSGLQLTVAALDAHAIPQRTLLNRTRWPRPEAELTYQTEFEGGMFKLFANGAWQKVYDFNGTPRSTSIYGVAGGGRVEVGPFHLGVAGHMGKGIGVTYSMEPNTSLYFTEQADVQPLASPIMRDVLGYYAHVEVSATPQWDVNAGFGVTQVKQLPQDVTAWEGIDPADLPPTGVASVGYVTLKQQMGIGAGITHHFTDQLHLQAEFFRAMFQWYKPIPTPAGVDYPSQTLNSVNLGMTYDW